MPLMDLNNSNFDVEIERYQLCLIDFWAVWCAPCKGFAPIFAQAAERHSDILFGKINTDEEADLAKQFEVRSIPTLLSSKDGTIVDVRLGSLTPEKLETLIQNLRKT